MIFTFRRFPLALAAALLLTAILASSASAAKGDNVSSIIADRTGTDCVSVNAEGDHASVGVGIAFDGTNLLISCYSDSTITQIDPSDGSQIAVHPISNAFSLGALAWDANEDQLWGCSDFGTVGIVDLTTDTFTPTFNTYSVMFGDGTFGSGCFDGLAYDGTDDTIWASGDVSSTTEHYSTTGLPVGKFTNGGLIGSCGNSGIAVGGPTVFLANNGCLEIYELEKDFSSSTLFASFPRRLEDLECDPITFADAGLEVMWSIDAYDNVLNAWEIPAGQCGFGGLPPGLGVDVDVHPTSCPNPFQLKKRGVVPVAILGSDTLDVTDIDPATIELVGPDGSVSPLRWSIEDVATPDEFPDPEDRNDCGTDGPDGYADLTLKFSAPEVEAVLGDVEPGDTVILTITGETFGGTAVSGVDIIWIR